MKKLARKLTGTRGLGVSDKVSAFWFRGLFSHDFRLDSKTQESGHQRREQTQGKREEERGGESDGVLK